MPDISKTIGGWTGTAPVPLAADAIQVALYELAMEGMNYERRVLYEQFHREENPISKAEYDAKCSILDDLETQYLALLLGIAPTVEWSQD